MRPHTIHLFSNADHIDIEGTRVQVTGPLDLGASSAASAKTGDKSPGSLKDNSPSLESGVIV